jgi:hypothetical protein
MADPSTTPEAVHKPASVFILTVDGAVIVGFSLSETVTVCVAVDVFPEPSVTVHVTVVDPNGKAAGALLTVDATEQLSDVVGVPKATPVATQDPASAFTVTFAGAVIEGAIKSCTVIKTSSVDVQPFNVEDRVYVVVDETVVDGFNTVDVNPAGALLHEKGGTVFPEITMLSIYQLLMFQTSPENLNLM